MQKVAIIGGGIAGLAAAHNLEKARRSGAAVEWSLYEADSRLGGVIKTDLREGFVLEAGPDSFLTAKPAAAELAGEVGLSDQLIHSNDSTRKTYILVRGKLVAMPDGLQMMVPTNPWATAVSPLLSLRTKIRMLGEYVSPPAPLAADQDESVASFVQRHFGREVVDRVAAPLLAGVYGGDADRLSARSVLPNFIAMETAHKSLVRATLHSRGKAKQPVQPLFTSFRGGMQQFTDAIVRQLPVSSIFSRCPVISFQHEQAGWRVISGDGRQQIYSALVLAVPAYVAGALLQSIDSGLAARLLEIEYASSTTALFSYNKKLLLPRGFGFLVPHGEGRRIMACTFVHQKFEHRAPAGNSLLRVFVSGLPAEDDSTLIAILRKELHEILGVAEEPQFTSISRWKQAMAQYGIGHEVRIREIEARAAALSGLHLIGNAFHGIGIPDCIRGAKNAAARLLT